MVCHKVLDGQIKYHPRPAIAEMSRRMWASADLHREARANFCFMRCMQAVIIFLVMNGLCRTVHSDVDFGRGVLQRSPAGHSHYHAKTRPIVTNSYCGLAATVQDGAQTISRSLEGPLDSHLAPLPQRYFLTPCRARLVRDHSARQFYSS